MSLEKLLIYAVSICAAILLVLFVMAWTSKPICAGQVVMFSQANVDGDMEAFGFKTAFGDLGMNPTVPGKFCIEIRKLK